MIMHRLDYIPLKWNFVKERKYPKYSSWEHAESSSLRLSHTRLTNSFEGNASARILRYSSIEFHNLDLRSFASSFRLASNAYRKALKQEFATRQIRQVRNAPLFFFLSSFFLYNDKSFIYDDVIRVMCTQLRAVYTRETDARASHQSWSRSSSSS